MDELERTVLVNIAGRVQGVWFRDWTKRKADKLGVAGWVRNRRDGRVEALFSGAAEQVEEMIQKCRSGPPLSRVDEVVLVEEEGEKPLQGFEIRETG